MDTKELQGLIDEASKALKTKAENAETKALEAFQKANELLSELTYTKSAMEANKTELEELRKQLNSLSADMNKPKFVKGANIKSWEEEVTEQFEKAETKLKSGSPQTTPVVFNLKSSPYSQKDAVTIGLNTTVEAVGSESQYTVTENTGIISAIRQRVLTYLNNVAVGSISKEYALWMEEVDEQGTPIFIGEGDAKTAISVRYEERNKKAKKIAVSAKVSMELMEDLPQLISYIQTNMMKRVDTSTENQLFNGNDTGDNLAGLVPYATTFTGGDMAGTVVASTINDWDVILGLISQVKKANGIANAMFISNGKLDSLRGKKTTDGHYIYPPGVLADAQGNITAWGIQLIGTNALPSNGSVDFVGGDLTAVNVRFRKGMTVQIGESGDDFINNLKTLLVEQRLVQFVSANDTPVIIKGTFDAAKDLLEATT